MASNLDCNLYAQMHWVYLNDVLHVIDAVLWSEALLADHASICTDPMARDYAEGMCL